MQIMTFGEFLSSTMKNKNISISRLAEITGMKSRNAIQRILKDESSIKVINAFKTRLIDLDPLELSDAELEQMEQSIEVSRVGKDTFGARKILGQLFGNSCPRKSESPAALNPVDQQTISLRELFATYKTFAKIRLLIFDAVSAEFSHELVNLIRTSPPSLIDISQILYLGNNRCHNAESLVSVFKLINYEHYDVYIIDSELILDSHSAVASNSVIIDKATSGGDHYTDLIKMDSDRSFSFIKDIPGNALYLFHLYHFNNLSINGQTVRRIYEKKTHFDTVLSICDLTVPLRENTNRYLVGHGLDYVMIPYDITMNMLAESDYLGMEENNPLVHELKQIWYQRFYDYYYIDTMKVCLLTKRGLLDFVKNKVLVDHLRYFRPFTTEEVKNILEFILKQLQEKAFFKILLLKNNYSIGNIQFSYFENKALWIFDVSSGYDEDYFEGFIDSTPILDIYDDFIKNELIKNHTLPESETIAYLQYLISLVE